MYVSPLRRARCVALRSQQRATVVLDVHDVHVRRASGACTARDANVELPSVQRALSPRGFSRVASVRASAVWIRRAVGIACLCRVPPSRRRLVARASEYRAHLRQYPGVTSAWTPHLERRDPGRGAHKVCVHLFSSCSRQVVLESANIALAIRDQHTRVAPKSRSGRRKSRTSIGADWYEFRSSGPRWKPHGCRHGGGAGGPRAWCAWPSLARSRPMPAI